jgi:hypothetical protein
MVMRFRRRDFSKLSLTKLKSTDKKIHTVSQGGKIGGGFSMQKYEK